MLKHFLKQLFERIHILLHPLFTELDASVKKIRRVDLYITIREGHDFLMDISSYGSLLHLLVTSRDATVANIIPDGVVEKHSILGNDANVSSQRDLLHLM